MPVQQNRMRITSDDGVATIWIGGGSEILFHDLDEFARKLEQLKQIAALDLIVLRADAEPGAPNFWQARPVLIGTDESAADRYSRRGTELLTTLRNLDVPTLAFIEGACTGLGLEFALSCVERFGISGPTANYSFGSTPTTWGGRTRARELFGKRRVEELTHRNLTARQAHRVGVLDQVCCQRRAKINLQAWIHHRQQTPVLERPRKWWSAPLENHLMAERRAFRRAALAGVFEPVSPQMGNTYPLQKLCKVALVGDHPHWPILSREWSLRGVKVQCVGFDAPAYNDAIQAGRVTPLEAQHASQRAELVADVVELRPTELVLLDEKSASMATMMERDLAARTLLVMPELAAQRLRNMAVRPQRVLGWHWQPEGYEFTGYDFATRQLAVWFSQLGVPHTIRETDVDRYEPMDATPLDIDYDGSAATLSIGTSRATPTSLHAD